VISGFIHEFAPAKINLSLAVGPLGKDGFHPIDSLVAFADFGDELSFAPARELTLHLSGPFAQHVPSGHDNLVLRAARVLAAKTGKIDTGAEIHLCKNLPVASGMGGGSTDAAATLRGLNRLWDTGLSAAELARIGAELGSDIPACVYGQRLRMCGRGEQIYILDAQPALATVLVNPGISISTAAVFAQFDQMQINPLDSNALCAPAILLAPVIGDVLSALRALPLHQLVQMSGSGATCFASFETETAAKQATQNLQQAHPKWWVKQVQIGANTAD